MRLAYLAAQTSVHAVRWVRALAERGHEVHLLTMHAAGDTPKGVKVWRLPFRPPWGYYLNARCVRDIVRRSSLVYFTPITQRATGI